MSQARDKVWSDMQPVWLDKKEFQKSLKKKYVFTIFKWRLHDFCMNIGRISVFTFNLDMKRKL